MSGEFYGGTGKQLSAHDHSSPIRPAAPIRKVVPSFGKATYDGDQGLIALQACQAYVRRISHGSRGFVEVKKGKISINFRRVLNLKSRSADKKGFCQSASPCVYLSLEGLFFCSCSQLFLRKRIASTLIFRFGPVTKSHARPLEAYSSTVRYFARQPNRKVLIGSECYPATGLLTSWNLIKRFLS